MTEIDIWTKWESKTVNGLYPLRRFLGRSNHSVVFLTECRAQNLPKAAIKLIPAEPASAEAQLARWKSLVALTHPNLMRVLDTGRCQLGGHPFLFVVMEYADQTLAQILPHRPLTVDEVRELLVPTLGALAYVHGKKLVQAQLKPSNFLVVNDQLRLASDTIRGAGESWSSGGKRSGYDPPEAATGTVHAAGDIWGLGVTLVEALTQIAPVLTRDPADTVSLPPELPVHFANTLWRCLNRNPAARPTVQELEAQLTQKPPVSAPENDRATGAAPARPSSSGPPPARPSAAGTPPASSSSPSSASDSSASDSSASDSSASADSASASAAPAAAAPPGSAPVSTAPLASTAPTVSAPSVSHAPSGPAPGPTSASPVPVRRVPATPAAARPVSRPPTLLRWIGPAIAVALIVMLVIWAAAPTSGNRNTPPIAGGTAQSAPQQSAPQPAASANSTSPTPAAPALVHQEIPVASRHALDSIHGQIKVEVLVTVDRSGSVTAQNLESRGSSRYFARIASDAAKKWRFTPADTAAPRQWLLEFDFTRSGATVQAAPRLRRPGS